MNHNKEFEKCFGVRRTPGAMRVGFRAETDGHVETASVTFSSFNDPALEDCILQVFKSMAFPKADRPTRAEYPFVQREKKD
jgi:hypothetical protein